MADTEPLKVRAAAWAGAVVGVVWRALPGMIPVGLLAWGASWAWPPGGPLTAGALLLADQVASRWPKRGGPR
jgi:hypothetical protein